MKAGVIVPLLVATGLGGAAVFVGKDVLQKQNGPQSVQTAAVLLASRDVQSGDELQDQDLTIGSLPAGSVPAGALTQKREAAGRVVAVPIQKGQIVFDAALAPRSAGTGMQALVPPGMRAVTIEVSESSGLSGMLSPGCRVDVISAFVDERTRQTVARAVIENAKVTNVGGRGKGTEGGALRTVTMIVTANEAMALELAAARGRPRIVLRGPGDDSRTTQPILTAADLVPAPPEPKVEAPATAPVTQPAPVPAPATRPEEPPRVIVVVEAPPPLPTPEEPPGHQIHVIRGSTESTVIVDKHPTTAPVVSPATRPGARPVVRRGN